MLYGDANILHDNGIQVFVDELATDGVILGLRGMGWIRGLLVYQMASE